MIKSYKKFGLLSIIGLFIISFSFGQHLGNIQVSFCDPNSNNQEMNIATKADQETEICISYLNKSNKNLTLQIDFVDGTITDNGNRSCLDSSKARPNFGQYVLDWDKEIVLPAGESITKKYFIKFPIGYSGISHGCLIYNVKNIDNSDNINVIFSKSHSIDILVGGIPVSSKIKLDSVLLSGNQIKKWLVLNLSNKGNIDQLIQISGSISNIFGYNEIFKIEPIILPTKDFVALSTTPLNLPDYKGLFSIKTNISYEPHFNFHINNLNTTDEYNEPGILSFSKTIILRNWFLIGSVVIILFLVFVIIIKKVRK